MSDDKLKIESNSNFYCLDTQCFFRVCKSTLTFLSHLHGQGTLWLAGPTKFQLFLNLCFMKEVQSACSFDVAHCFHISSEINWNITVWPWAGNSSNTLYLYVQQRSFLNNLVPLCEEKLMGLSREMTGFFTIPSSTPARRPTKQEPLSTSYRPSGCNSRRGSEPGLNNPCNGVFEWGGGEGSWLMRCSMAGYELYTQPSHSFFPSW